MIELKARLEGGPFDGDEGLIDEAPPKIWVTCCKHGPSCSTQWYGAWVKGGEVYRRADPDDETVRYVYSSLNDLPSDELVTTIPDVGRLLTV